MSKWIEGKLKDLVEVNPTVKLRKGEIYPFVSMDVIQPFYKPVEAKEEREFKSGGAKFENGDTLFARITPCLENGKIAQVKNLKNGKGFGSTEFIVLRGKEGITDTDFVYYLVTNKSFRENAERLMVGTSGRQRVDKQQFEDQIISIPDLETQKRISSILGSIDKKIELNIEMNKTLEEMAMTLYKHWFVDFGPFQDGEFVESELGVIPNNWKIGQVKDLAKVLSGKRPKVKDIGEYPIFGGGGPMGVTNEYLYNEPIFITGRVGTIGKVFRVSKPCWPSDNSLVLIPLKAYYYSFLYAVLKNIDFSLITGGSTQPLITQTSLKSIKVIIPPEETIEQYNKQVLTYYSLIDKNDNINKQLSEIRDYLLPRLLSGEIDVSKAEKQVEKVL
ncbi:MAG: restriction endonuclease subunit S [Caldibacillus debilis]|uniref:Restriction endonuclease subunit S n=1 Tax=Caldibacillus debilis TaxID=301148 RepID=A0A3E0JXY2_9BACI|nr:restriction endonuclease subunit S [Caldibacillus debilis]REJ25115.1 MAG: restriction endonuclease subunit S [Caldibacillus debilis]